MTHLLSSAWDLPPLDSRHLQDRLIDGIQTA